MLFHPRVKFLLPIDIVVAPEFAENANPTLVSANEIPNDQMGLDIGPETARAFAEAIKGCKTVFWNGPMGVFENPCLALGTIAVAKAMAEAEGATTIIGGGDSAAAVATLGFADKMSHISTGGGAFLEWLEGRQAPFQLNTIQGIVIFGTGLAVYVFLIRVLARLTFSSYHLMRDAEEREQLNRIFSHWLQIFEPSVDG